MLLRMFGFASRFAIKRSKVKRCKHFCDRFDVAECGLKEFILCLCTLFTWSLLVRMKNLVTYRASFSARHENSGIYVFPFEYFCKLHASLLSLTYSLTLPVPLGTHVSVRMHAYSMMHEFFPK